MELHGTVGPTRTTISAVAERAGVQRDGLPALPDGGGPLRRLLRALGLAPPAAPAEEWTAIADPDERLRAGLADIYR